MLRDSSVVLRDSSVVLRDSSLVLEGLTRVHLPLTVLFQTPPRVITLDNYNFPSAMDEDYQRPDLAQPLSAGSANRISQISRPLDLSADQRSAPTTVQFRFVCAWFAVVSFSKIEP